MKTRVINKLFYLIASITLLFSTGNATANDTVFTFSVVPQQSATKTAKVWGPLLKYLETKTGYQFQLKTNINIPEFETDLKSERYDFSYMNPYHYVTFHDSANYNALAKAKDKKIKGIMVVAKNSTITKLEDLDGKELAFPSPAAFAASILPRAYMKQQGIKFSPKYVSSHDSVYSNVSRNKYVSGGGVVRTFKNTNKRYKKKLRVLWTTEGYTPHAIAAHKRIPIDVVTSVQKALASIGKTEKGKAVLKGLKVKGFVNAINSDWDDVRALNINELK